MKRPAGSVEEMLWRFVKSAINTDDFESWVYQTAELQTALQPDDYDALLIMNYKEAGSSASTRRQDIVREISERAFPRTCSCLSMGDLDRTVLSAKGPMDATSDIRACQTPWINLRECRDCGTFWLEGIDTVDGDVYLVRLKAEEAKSILKQDRWLPVFEGNDNLWPDEAWLKAFGFSTLQEWRAKNPPPAGD